LQLKHAARRDAGNVTPALDRETNTMTDEQTVTDLALRICRQTRTLLRQHRPQSEQEWYTLVDEAHREALAEIADPALRFRVAEALSYQSVEGKRT
jgi:hypothetical protein